MTEPRTKEERAKAAADKMTRHLDHHPHLLLLMDMWLIAYDTAIEDAAKVCDRTLERKDIASKAAYRMGRHIVASHRESDSETCVEIKNQIRALGAEKKGE